ncbi:MAG: acyltransferase domain-containing protein [Spirochaetota bacterium]
MSSEKFSRKEIQGIIADKLSSKVGISTKDIDPRERFNRYGLKSAKATEMISELSKQLEVNLPITCVWDYPSIEKLSNFISGTLLSSDKGTSNASTSKSDNNSVTISKNADMNEPIAVIGMACRFPQANNKDEYWKLLTNGVDAIREVPKARWSLDDFYSEDKSSPGDMSTKWGGFLDEVDKFDAGFFGISPKEAQFMDPQQRLMLELSWEALEDSRVVVDDLKGSDTSVFFGVIWNDYATLLDKNSTDYIAQHTATGSHYSIVANRVSYVFGFEGPSMAIDTACSSSLVAIHLACQSLRSGESSLALAGGVNLIIAPDSTVAMSKFGAMAPDGRSKAFDSRANGYVRGEGGGVVALKPLSQALKDGNQIYAVVKGSAVNNDGFSNGLTAPNPKAQESVLRMAYKKAQIDTKDVQYVETHGTGTMLGDPIEAGALGEILGKGRDSNSPLTIGSVKTNIGHLEAAAGIAGFIKLVLSMKNKTIPKSLNFIKPNPHILFDKINVRVQTETAEWPQTEIAQGGVSSFGFGGTNCHVVVQEFPEEQVDILSLSAKDTQSLKSLAKTCKGYIEKSNESFTDICNTFTSNDINSSNAKLAITANSKEKVSELLQSFLIGAEHPGISFGTNLKNKKPKIVFVFPGQGSQWIGMGLNLMRKEPVFRAKLEQCDEKIQSIGGWSLLEELAKEGAASRLNDLGIVQPVLFSIEVALAELWKSWGVIPDVVLGHSMGEVAAAHIAGILDLTDAVKVICYRSELAKKTAGQGGMSVVDLPYAETEKVIAKYKDKVSIASSNSPTSTVISGDPNSLKEICASLEEKGTFAKMINVDFASHSPQMDQIKTELFELLKGVYPRRQECKIFSTVFCEFLEGRRFEASYWVRNIREPVLFSKATETLLNEDYSIFLEMSPHPVLEAAIQQSIKFHDKEAVVLPSFRRNEDEKTVLLDSVGKLFANGVQIGWRNLHPTNFNKIILSQEITSLLPDSSSDSIINSTPRVFAFSAKSKKALKDKLLQFSSFMQENEQVQFNVLSANTVLDVNFFEYRQVLVAYNKDELKQKLEKIISRLDSGEIQIKRCNIRGEASPVFIYSGQGQQWIGMGKGLIENEIIVKKKLQEIDDLFKEHTESWSIMDILLKSENGKYLEETEYAQPCIFALQVALTELWKSWGMIPKAVVGHSVGEVAAAHIAGVLSLKDAVKVIYYRSKYMQDSTGKGGKMAAIRLNADFTMEAVEELLVPYKEKLSIGVYNSSDSVVLSGDGDVLSEVLDTLKEKNILHKLLPVNYAFHSPQMEPYRSPLVSSLFGIEVHKYSIPIVSTVRGSIAQIEDYDAEYWGRNVVGSVRFNDAIEYLLDEGHQNFIEISAHPVLKDYMASALRKNDTKGMVIPSMLREKDNQFTLLESIAKLFTEGYAFNFHKLYPEGNAKIQLPHYPWQKERFWPEFASNGALRRYKNGESVVPPKKDTTEVDSSQKVDTVDAGSDTNNSTVQGTALPEEKSSDEKVEEPKESLEVTKEEPVTVDDSNQSESIENRVSLLLIDILGLDSPSDIDPEKPFPEMGLDSIMSVELRGSIEKEFKIKLIDTYVADYPDLNSLCKFILSKGPSSSVKAVSPKPVAKKVKTTTPKVEKPVVVAKKETAAKEPAVPKKTTTKPSPTPKPVAKKVVTETKPKEKQEKSPKVEASDSGSVLQKTLLLISKVLELDLQSGQQF